MLRSFAGSTSVDSAEFGYTFGYTMSPPDKILLARIHSGAMELHAEHGPPAVFGPGDGPIRLTDSTPVSAAANRHHYEDRRDSTPVLPRRAIAFIDDKAQRDLSLVDIAEAIDVSPRAVQYMFRKHRDCTPMQYLRQIRLQYAHLDLIADNPSSSSVRTIAYRWGFAHMGRFSAGYRSAFGQSPHVTFRS